MKVYVSGPMTGLPDLGFGALKAATARFRADGYDVICPTETPKPVRADGDEPTHSDWMRASLRRLCDADVIVMLPGWHDSMGCQQERNAAGAIGCMIVDIGEPRLDEALRWYAVKRPGRAP